jgi:hypothetical protein
MHAKNYKILLYRCNMTLLKMAEEEMGEWTCRVDHSLTHQFQALL